ncbi:MAG TPA: hypothetical protein VF665_01150 [Longimicrobium sp.]|jgi:hypothetical protein|uniref:hypothetical protein n=1 Tax=Longimicrobium sp. TaxID=2029185 RepID=UPI002ED9F3D9
MLIDDFLPKADFSERHAVRTSASPAQAYAAVRRLDMSGSWIIRALFALRSLPGRLAGRKARGEAPLGTRMDGLLRGGFVLLAEDAPREIVLGLTGRFWKPAGDLRRVEADAFRAFNEPGMTVAAWNFAVLPAERGSLIVTETRVRCTDPHALRMFGRYWRLVGPFSGLIRREMLRGIRNDAERAGG